MTSYIHENREPRSIAAKLGQIDWALPVLAIAVSLVGVAALYSTAGGQIDPWAGRHAIRAAVGLLVIIGVGLIPPRVWLRLANPIYVTVLAMLLAVPLIGYSQLGARRWLGAGEFSLQPAEMMKIALVLALARYYQWLPAGRRSQLLWLAPPLVMIAIPVALVLKQPDLGTAVLILAAGIAVLFLAGIRPLFFVIGGMVAAGLAQGVWPYLKDYQRRRLLTFLDPGQDPLGAGYHIAQSKIALGSGGLHGRGFLGGTQSQLNFLPEKHTDFIFTMLGEETGFIGAVGLMVLYAALIGALFVVALRGRSTFARLLAAGVGMLFALHVTVNIGMVCGLLPVVGVPLPLVSYGGTSLLTLMFGLGLAVSMAVHRHDPLRRPDAGTLW